MNFSPNQKMRLSQDDCEMIGISIPSAMKDLVILTIPDHYAGFKIEVSARKANTELDFLREYIFESPPINLLDLIKTISSQILMLESYMQKHSFKE